MTRSAPAVPEGYRPDDVAAIYVARLGTPLPTSLDEPLIPAYKFCGWIAHPGMTYIGREAVLTGVRVRPGPPLMWGVITAYVLESPANATIRSRITAASGRFTWPGDLDIPLKDPLADPVDNMAIHLLQADGAKCLLTIYTPIRLAVAFAPPGTPLPTTWDEPLADAFHVVGHINTSEQTPEMYLGVLKAPFASRVPQYQWPLGPAVLTGYDHTGKPVRLVIPTVRRIEMSTHHNGNEPETTLRIIAAPDLNHVYATWFGHQWQRPVDSGLSRPLVNHQIDALRYMLTAHTLKRPDPAMQPATAVATTTVLSCAENAARSITGAETVAATITDSETRAAVLLDAAEHWTVLTDVLAKNASVVASERAERNNGGNS